MVSSSMQVTEQMPERLKVKRDGPRGWHWIAAAHYDPTKHELVDAPAAPAPTVATVPAAKAEPTAPAKRGPGRPRKVTTEHRMEALHGNR
jgi:hypothetical protein